MGRKRKRKKKNTVSSQVSQHPETTPKSPEENKPQTSPKISEGAIVTRRKALLAIAATTVGMVIWKTRSDETDTPNTQPTVSPEASTPKFERRIEVQNVTVTLGESWGIYQPPEGTSVSDLFRQEFERIVPFYKRFGINLEGKAFHFEHDPSYSINGNTAMKAQPLHPGVVNTPHFNEQGKLNPLFYLARNITPNPHSITLGRLRPATIAHEIVHTLFQLITAASDLWTEGLAEAIEGLYIKAYPGSEKYQIKEIPPEITERIRRAKQDDDFIAIPEVWERLTAVGWEENWILADPERKKPREQRHGHFSRTIAGRLWQGFLEEHPTFLSSFLERARRDVIWHQQSIPEESRHDDLQVLSNSLYLRDIGMRAYGSTFTNWYDQQIPFTAPTADQHLSFAYMHPGKTRITVVSARRKSVVQEPAQYRSISPTPRTIHELHPQPYQLERVGYEPFQIAPEQIRFEIKETNGKPFQNIARIVNRDGQEIPIINQ